MKVLNKQNTSVILYSPSGDSVMIPAGATCKIPEEFTHDIPRQSLHILEGVQATQQLPKAKK